MPMSIPRVERDAGNIGKVEEVGLLNGGAIVHPCLKRIGIQQRERIKVKVQIQYKACHV